MKSSPGLVDTLLFDMDGTILDLGFDNRFWRDVVPRAVAARAENEQRCPHTARDAILADMLRLRGNLSWYCLDNWEQRTGLDLVALKDEVRHLLGWQPGAREVLQALRMAGFRMVLVTNAHPRTLAFKDRHLDVRSYFDRVYDAHTFGAAKEDPLFWERLAARLEGWSPECSWLVDDNLDVLRTARAWGVSDVRGMRLPDLAGPELVSEEFLLLESLERLPEHLDAAGVVPPNASGLRGMSGSAG